jgi:Zn-dependent peptidase ImmA (M78 family)
MLTIDLFEELEGPPEPTLIDALRDFLPIAVKHLKIKKLPKIKLLRDVETGHMPSFGKFSNDDRTVHLGIKNRHPNDVLRTLAHELTHYVQGEHGKLDADSWHTGSPAENDANAQAGVVMREFNKKFPKYLKLKPIVVENCDAKNAVPELKAALTKRKSELKNADAKVAYDKIDKIMTRIAQTYNISGQELHDLWTERYGEIPDTWVLD